MAGCYWTGNCNCPGFGRRTGKDAGRPGCRGTLYSGLRGHWLLVRRSIANPGYLAQYACFGPAETAWEDLVSVAGTRWTIEECFEKDKGQVGLDPYDVRKWNGWYRDITLAMLAHAYLNVVTNQAALQGCSEGKGAVPVLMKG